METKGVSIVLGTYNRKNFLKLTISSIRNEMALCDFPYEIIVIDGGSTDGTVSWLLKQKDILTIIQHNRGKWEGKEIIRKSWGYFMNLGFKCAQKKYICMLSDDCLVIPNAIKNGYSFFEQQLNSKQNIGAIAFYWRNWPQHEKYRVGLTLGDKMFVNHGMYLRKALEDVHYIDEDTFHFYHADGDLCLKMWQIGYCVIESPNSFIEHYAHANISVRKSNLMKQKIDWNNYLNKWHEVFLNPNKMNIGGWIEKEYTDPSHIVKKFQIIHSFQIRLYLSRCCFKMYNLMKNYVVRRNEI